MSAERPPLIITIAPDDDENSMSAERPPLIITILPDADGEWLDVLKYSLTLVKSSPNPAELTPLQFYIIRLIWKSVHLKGLPRENDPADLAKLEKELEKKIDEAADEAATSIVRKIREEVIKYATEAKREHDAKH